MKYYSEETKKVYDTEEELRKAEAKLDEARLEQQAKKEQRAARAKEVEDAFIEAGKARENAHKLLTEFCKDYGSFHTTLKEPFSNIFNLFWDF